MYAASLAGSFSGFDDNEDAAVRAARVKKLGVSKKWTVAALRDLCTLLGLEKGGDKVMGRSRNGTGTVAFFLYGFVSKMSGDMSIKGVGPSASH